MRRRGGILRLRRAPLRALSDAIPFPARLLLRFFRHPALGRHPCPRHFDRNLVVIGGGSAGLVAAYIAAAAKARVTLIERARMGGDCLNTGCVPSKALIRSARFLAEARQAARLGMRSAEVHFDFAEVMARIERVVRSVAPRDSVERYRRFGVECLTGACARILSPYSVEVEGRTLTTRAIVIATGAKPIVPALPGLAQAPHVTSETLWSLRELPRRLVVLGGGPVGCELAQCFARFGSEVSVIQRRQQLLPREDPEFSLLVQERFRQEGIALHLAHAAQAVRTDLGGAHRLICAHEGREVAIPFDLLLLAVGRRADVAGLGLEELGVGLGADGTVALNEYLQTHLPSIYACGDVAGPFQFTHTASHQAWYAAVNALFGSLRRFKADYSVIPWATFTDPEVARVGVNEIQARERGIDYEVTRFPYAELDRAAAEEATEGMLKILTVPGKDRILGATIAGAHAADIIAELVLAMRHRLGLRKLLGTVHIYPTWSEVNKLAAGAWQRAHAPQRLLRWVERYHRWRRG